MSNDSQKTTADPRYLPSDERQDVLAVFNETPEEWPAAVASNVEGEEAYQRVLLEAGLISKVHPRRRDQRLFERFQPISFIGEPVSQTIIQDRR